MGLPAHSTTPFPLPEVARKGTVLRGHHLLCVLGFEGHGYSQEHAAHLWTLVARLRRPKALVEVSEVPDDICHHCPHLQANGCDRRGPESEAWVRKQDQQVLERLALTPGSVLPWLEVEERIKRSIAPSDLEHLCQDCPWLSLGLCARGLRELAS